MKTKRKDEKTKPNKGHEERYRDLFENAPDGYHSIGPDGTILEVNNTWLRMLGYERNEVIGKIKLTELLTNEGLKIFQNTFPEFKKKGLIETVEYDLKKKDGTMLPVLINATAVYDENGNFLKSRSIVRDNSVKKNHEKMLEHASDEWKATFDSLPNGVILLDREYNIIKTNDYISRLTGIPIKELIGKKCYELVHGTDKPIKGCPVLRSTNSRSTETLERYEPKLDKYFMLYASPILDEEGLIKAYVHSLVDITEIKDKEDKLIKSRDAFFNMLTDLDFSFRELKSIYNGLVFSLVYAIDAKSPWTKGHSIRVTNYALAIAKEMGLKDKDIETLRTAALLHDIGKIGTYDIVLDKTEKLTAEEFDLVKMHPAKGEEILKPISQLQNILPIIRSHHERIDGKGYPDGLKGDEIHFLARIICIADSFDSMTSERPYRPSPGIEYAISELKSCSGTQFDPQAAEAFLRVLSK
ncbi:MAG: PAS domain S-box protein [Nitrospirota bacterium]|nr:PAS domain S-box protein [Nitrospirota bacterium]